MDQLTEDRIREIKEVFFFYGRRGTISTEHLGIAMRVLGQNPTEAELQDIISNKLVNPGNRTIGIPEFVSIMSKRMKEHKELRDNNPFISVADLRSLMTCFDDKWTNDEIDRMLQEEANPDVDGKVKYKEFIKVTGKMLTRYETDG